MDKIQFVLTILNQICPYTQIEPTTELIGSGILTSVSLIELIVEIENGLNIRIAEELIAAENFETAETIAKTVLGEVDS